MRSSRQPVEGAIWDYPKQGTPAINPDWGCFLFSTLTLRVPKNWQITMILSDLLASLAWSTEASPTLLGTGSCTEAPQKKTSKWITWVNIKWVTLAEGNFSETRIKYRVQLSTPVAFCCLRRGVLSMVFPTHSINRSEFKSHYIASLVLSMMTMTSAAAGFNLTLKKRTHPKYGSNMFSFSSSGDKYTYVWYCLGELFGCGRTWGLVPHVQNCFVSFNHETTNQISIQIIHFHRISL